MKLAGLIYAALSSIDGISQAEFCSAVFGPIDRSDDQGSQTLASGGELFERISSALSAINLGLQRLFTSGKTLLKTTVVYPISSSEIKFQNGVVTAVVTDSGRGHRISFKAIPDGVLVDRKDIPSSPMKSALLIEYRPSIPFFTLDDIRELSIGDENEPEYVEKEVNLLDYGVTDEMCAYLIEYAKGQMYEIISPDLAAMHINNAEAYIASLKTVYTSFPQEHVGNVRYSGRYF